MRPLVFACSSAVRGAAAACALLSPLLRPLPAVADLHRRCLHRALPPHPPPQHFCPPRRFAPNRLRGRTVGTGGAFGMSSLADASEKHESFTFGPYQISQGEVFLTTKLCFAFVNLRPVVPDVLVCPRRLVTRFAELTVEEVTDLWLTAQRVGEKLEPFFDGSSLTLAIQDGPEAGQSVAHVHVHILPRKKADFENNDEIYDEIDKKEKEMKDHLNLDQERKDRTREVMHEEAAKLRALF